MEGAQRDMAVDKTITTETSRVEKLDAARKNCNHDQAFPSDMGCRACQGLR